jgi:hypothetical protein
MSKKKSNINKSLSDAAARLGHEGGKRGGPARSLKLSKSQREEIARQGGLAKAAKEIGKGKRALAVKQSDKTKDETKSVSKKAHKKGKKK